MRTTTTLILIFCFTVTVYAFPVTPDTLRPFTESIPGSVVSIDMVPVVLSDSSAFWMSATEIPWDVYDIYVFGLDQTTDTGPDAVARPSKPYVLPGEHFGHEGYPALGMTFKAATQFTRWLSAKLGKNYRLPTQSEWIAACEAGAAEDLAENVWYFDNSDFQTQKVGTKPADATGLHDMRGNVAEWVDCGDEKPVVMGGYYKTMEGKISCSTQMFQTSAWNMTDPQLPKSTWWLSDAPFVGFRIVHDP